MKLHRQAIGPAGTDVRIHFVRGQRVILDFQLAAIYGVTTKRLNEQVKRNAKRFPPDFVFRINPSEVQVVLRSRSQFATLKRGQNLKYRPYAFTEHGAVMAANVLNSSDAVRMSVFVVRAFIQMRETIFSSQEFAAQLRKLESKLNGRLDVHESAIVEVLQRIMDLLNPPIAPLAPQRSMGFHAVAKSATRSSTRRA